MRSTDEDGPSGPLPPEVVAVAALHRPTKLARVLGLADPLSPVPTVHRLLSPHGLRYTHTALGALTLPLLEGEPGAVKSTDPSSGETVYCNVDGDLVSCLSHADAVLSVCARDGDLGVATGCWPYIRMFTDPHSYEAWHRSVGPLVGGCLPLARAMALVHAMTPVLSEVRRWSARASRIPDGTIVVTGGTGGTRIVRGPGR